MEAFNRKPTAPIAALQQTPSQFEVYQAARLLQTANDNAANNTDIDEYVHFSSVGLSQFPCAEVLQVDQTSSKACLKVPSMALTGHFGVLPNTYSEWLDQQADNGNEALKSFLDIFNHRLWSLFIDLKKNFRTQDEHDYRTEWANSLRSLVGLNTAKLIEQLSIPEIKLLALSQLLMAAKPSLGQIKQVLSILLNIDVKIKKLVGGFVSLEDDQVSLLSAKSASYNQLGIDLVVGKRIWNQHKAIEITIFTKTLEDFLKLLPGQQHYLLLREILFFLTRKRIDIHIKLILPKSEEPLAKLYRNKSWRLSSQASDNFVQGRLGHNTDLASKEQQNNLGNNLFQLGRTSWLTSQRSLTKDNTKQSAVVRFTLNPYSSDQ